MDLTGILPREYKYSKSEWEKKKRGLFSKSFHIRERERERERRLTHPHIAFINRIGQSSQTFYHYYQIVTNLRELVKRKKREFSQLIILSFVLFSGIIGNMEDYAITISYDEEAAVWYAVNDDIPIALESDSIEVLMERVKLAAPELLELNGKNYEHTVLHFTMEREAVLA
jgi:hypothetical protein